MYQIQHYRESAEYIRSRLNGLQPEVLIILGSGLGTLAEMAEGATYIPYADVPHFKSSTALGHANRFVAGYVSGKPVLMMQGRMHVYEGNTMEDVAYPVRTARLLGIQKMVVTNAAGGVNTGFSVGQIMLIRDYIKFTYGNPLVGPNIEEFGPRFPDMSTTFDREYMAIFKEVASQRGDEIAEGNYFYMSGPQYETPAEIRAIRTLGGDAVGMSTVPECIAANHAGMRILGISLITNMAAGVLDKPLSGEEVVEAGNAASSRLTGHVKAFLERV